MSRPVPRQLDLYELRKPRPELNESDMWACRTVPFVAVRPGTTPPTEKIIASHPQVAADRVFVLVGLDYLISANVDVINCSLGFRGSFDARDPLSRVSRAATDAGISVVVAAGNAGPQQNSMQELALAPWVISVGALDREGTLLTKSSRGSPTRPGPTVVADGWLPYMHRVVIDLSSAKGGEQPTEKHLAGQPPGTSFAAPRVSHEVAFIRKVLELATKYIRACASEDGEPRPIRVRLPVVGFVDTGVDPDFVDDANAGPVRRELMDESATEVVFAPVAAECDWCRAMAAELGDADLSVTPETVRRALELMAEPLDLERWEVGAGRVSREVTRSFCANLTPSRLVDLVAPHVARSWSSSFRVRRDQVLGPLWDDGQVSVLEDVFGTGHLFAVAKVV